MRGTCRYGWRKRGAVQEAVCGFSKHRPTLATIRWTPRRATSCSHTLMTRQPLCRRSLDCLASRSRFAEIFSVHHARFVFGTSKCFAHPCQKHPSMNTQTFAVGNTMSAVQRRSRSGRASIRNRKPSARRADRNNCSGAVIRPTFACITRRVASDDATGARARIESRCLTALPRLRPPASRLPFLRVRLQVPSRVAPRTVRRPL
jgi:hypothetical protein